MTRIGEAAGRQIGRNQSVGKEANVTELATLLVFVFEFLQLGWQALRQIIATK